jgi:hypothetical protein
MTNEDLWRHKRLGKIVRGSDQVADVAGEVRVGEITFAFAKTGKIKPQHRNARIVQRSGNDSRQYGVERNPTSNDRPTQAISSAVLSKEAL